MDGEVRPFFFFKAICKAEKNNNIWEEKEGEKILASLYLLLSENSNVSVIENATGS